MQVILSFCEENGMRVILGLFLSEDIEGNEREMEALSLLVERYGQIVDAIVVGNETLFLKVVRHPSHLLC